MNRTNEFRNPSTLAQLQKIPARVWASFLRWLRSLVRPSQCLETHLKRQSVLAGTRERMSTMRSSVSLPAAVPLEGEEEDLRKHGEKRVRESVKRKGKRFNR